MRAFALVCVFVFAFGCSPKGHGGERTPSDDQYCPEQTPQAYAIIDPGAATKAGCTQARVHQSTKHPETGQPTYDEIVVWCCRAP